MADTSSSVHLEKDNSFLPEIWAWFIIGCVAVALRYIVRIRTVGFRGFAGDDYVTILTLGFYTMDAALVHIVYHTGANADLTPEIVNNLSDKQIATFVYGSRCETAAWYSYTALIWCMKFTMLFFYKRLTIGTWQSRMIKHLFWLCGLSYLAVFLTLTFGCIPIQDNWRVRPLPGRQCTFKTQNLLVTVTLNVLTDAAILLIPIPLLWRLRVSRARKLAVAALLSSGVFVIAAAVVRAALTLGAAPSALNINRWGVRETVIGLLTVNVPILRPLWSRAFWRPGLYRPSTAAGGSGGSAPWGGTVGTGGAGAGGGPAAKLRRSVAGHAKGLGYRGTFELRSAAEEEGGVVVEGEEEDAGSTYSKSAPSVAVARVPSETGSEDGFVRAERGGRSLSRDLEAAGGEGGLGMGQGRTPTTMVFVETTYEIRTSDRDEVASLATRGSGTWGRSGNARGAVGYDTRIEVLGGSV